MTWTINGDSSDNSPASVETDGHNGSPPLLKPGDSDTFEFWFRSRGPADDHQQRFEDAHAFAADAGNYNTYPTIENDIHWREDDPNGISPLVEIVPPPAYAIGPHIWGLIESAEATISTPESRCILSLSILKIAAVGTGSGEFETESAIRAAREVTGP